MSTETRLGLSQPDVAAECALWVADVRTALGGLPLCQRGELLAEAERFAHRRAAEAGPNVPPRAILPDVQFYADELCRGAGYLRLHQRRR